MSSAVVSGGLGAIATAGVRACLKRSPNLTQFYLLHPPFEKPKIASVLETFEESQRGMLTPIECDITSESAVEKAFSRMDSNSLSVLINAAGIAPLAQIEDYPLDVFRRNIDVNLIGPFLTSRAFAKVLMSDPKPRSGRMIHLSSQAAHIALDGHTGYSAAKAGLLAMSRSIASELSQKGNTSITSVTISPTVVETPLGKEIWAGTKGVEFSDRVPLKRFATEEEIGELIAFLVDPCTQMINGADIRVDGGYTIR